MGNDCGKGSCVDRHGYYLVKYIDMDDIPEIKPQSVLDPPRLGEAGPPQIKLDEPVREAGAIDPPKKTFRGMFKLKLSRPHFSFSGSAKRRRIFMSILGVFTILFVLSVFLVILPGISLYRQASKINVSARALKDSVSSQDINVVKGKLQVFKQDLANFKGSFDRFSWTQAVPWVGSYWKDGEAATLAATYGVETGEVVIETIEPYADIIGFAGPNSKVAQNGSETANDRIDFLVQSIGNIIPKMDDITKKAMLAKAEIDKIDASRYPEKFRGMEVQSKIRQVKELADESAGFIAGSKPLMQEAPYLLGIDSPRTYLVLFQNDKELRPTGGFLTAYSIMRVSSGKVEPVISSDIYNLDNNYKPSVEAPDPFVTYLKGPYILSKKYRLRDMNWSPDFKESMNLFTAEAEKAGVKDIDGVIAVDTHVLTNILDVLGQIGVPGFGNFSTENDSRCDCPNVIYELESFADVEGAVVWSENEPGKIVFAPPNYDNRKKIVGPLMNSVLSNALGQPKEKLPGLFNAAWKSVSEKHILFYMFDDKAQSAVEAFGIAGKVADATGDYLLIDDANLGGRKSNLYVTQDVEQKIDIARDGTITKTLTITYKNPQSQDGWLNSVLPNWTRIYVPKGSTLISKDGFEEDGGTYDDLGKTVFAGGFQLRPQGVKQVEVKYKLPFKAQKDYEVLIQKQPGLDGPLYSVTLGKQKDEFLLKTDKTLKYKI